MTEKLEQLYTDYLVMHSQKIEEGYSGMAIAGIIMTQALSMYRTALSPEEYDRMIAHILDTKDSVKTFRPEQTH